MSDGMGVSNAAGLVKQSRYAHAFLHGHHSIFFNSLTYELLQGDAVDYNVWQRFATPQPVAAAADAKAFLDTGLLVPMDSDASGQALRRLREQRLAAARNRRGRIGFMRIALTERCNMACSYCFQQKLFEEFQPVMSRERFSEIMEWFITQNTDYVPTVQYFGGEPLLRAELIRLGNDLLQAAQAQGRIRGYMQSLTTNGTLMTPEIAEFLVTNRFDVIFSLDGWQETNDALRVFKNGKGTYEDVLKGLEVYQRAGGRVSILVTPRSDNVAILPQIACFFVDQLGAVQIGINAPQPTANGWEADGEALARSIQSIWDFCSERGVHFHSLGTHIPGHIARKLSQTDRCIDATLGEDEADWPAYVSADGDVSYCVVHHRDDRCTHRSDELIVLEDKFRGWHFNPIEHDECDECIASQVCGGPCSLELAFRQGELNPDRCRFYKSMVQWVVMK